MTLAMIAVLTTVHVSILAAPDESRTPADAFAWGADKSGFKLGIRIEKVDSDCGDLYSFTIVALNSTDKPIRLASGDSWNGPIVPQYVFDDGKREWKISPPHVTGVGRGITHIPRPHVLELKPDTLTTLHKGLFVPPMAAGKWNVRAMFLVSGNRLHSSARERLEREGVWMSGYFVSGKVTLRMKNDQRQESRTKAPASLQRHSPAPPRVPKE